MEEMKIVAIESNGRPIVQMGQFMKHVLALSVEEMLLIARNRAYPWSVRSTRTMGVIFHAFNESPNTCSSSIRALRPQFRVNSR